MSCGPAEALKGLADGIDILDDKIDSLYIICVIFFTILFYL